MKNSVNLLNVIIMLAALLCLTFAAQRVVAVEMITDET
jgi:hypothetical protein